ncbi:7871_t:CDS:2 [Paraglomus brasilianum]|uniref:7871_t:CDS:1 n=1 Tax=Paraglomus brasilianum TaxID=144538 RepID=A0A9N8WBN6_9GLOM|nr:7871_t:CDS:2 [Paraglomus brasilianum]
MATKDWPVAAGPQHGVRRRKQYDTPRRKLWRILSSVFLERDGTATTVGLQRHGMDVEQGPVNESFLSSDKQRDGTATTVGLQRHGRDFKHLSVSR